MTNKDQISIDTKTRCGLEERATLLIVHEIIRHSQNLDRPRTMTELARKLFMDPRKLARWCKKLGIDIHAC